MAFEGVLLRDGTMTASADLSASTNQYKAVALSGANTVNVVASGGIAMAGVLQNTPASGDAADVAFFGLSKVMAGASYSANDDLMLDSSGRFITWTAGSGNVKVGKAREAAGGAGEIHTAFIWNVPLKVLT